MGIMDAFTSETPVEMKQPAYFELVKAAATAEILKKGIKAGVPAPYLEALETGKIVWPEPAADEEPDPDQKERPDADLWGVLAAAAKGIFNEFDDFRDVEEMQAAIEATVESLAQARICALEGMDRKKPEAEKEIEDREYLENVIDDFIEYLFSTHKQDRPLQIRVLFDNDTIEGPDGEKGFGVFIPERMKIYVAGDVPERERTILHTLAHEYEHYLQYAAGADFNEEEAENFAEMTVKNFYNCRVCRAEE